MVPADISAAGTTRRCTAIMATMIAASASTTGPDRPRRPTHQAKNTDQAHSVTSTAASHAPETAAVAASGAATTTATAIHSRSPTAYQPTSWCRARSDGPPGPRGYPRQRLAAPVPLIASPAALIDVREQYAVVNHKLRQES